ncbi:MBL fold metallo-hydrolase [Luteibacter sp. 329MFSha]|uniref:MBL fold metallo-hydrolase n=1 Tax=Luteibacter sp. 329MFSha TaxID=1798239 RepID=UPI0008AB61DD|nr:MBL fold metallo-hydrolase [Luteibacter sp. 329MFSha]SEV89775.1 Glyoxylase, beta-lactamase superfamily II [Luteibacter sp. 329MFSha]
MKRVALLVALLLTTAVAAAGDVRIGPQGPGFYRMRVGADEVTALLDGTHPFPADELLTHVDRARVDDLLKAEYLASPVQGSINAFLVKTADRLVLIDTGAGPLYAGDGGFLPMALLASGYRPEDVTDILLTHLHRDHVGGLIRNGTMLFPNATVHVSKADADFWLDTANERKVKDILLPMFPGAMDSLGPYLKAGRVATFQGETDVLPGFHAIPAPGHTPGHTWYLVTSGSEHLLAWGDTVHVAAVQLAEPGASIRYDVDEEAAAASRKRALDEAVAKGYWVAAAHVSFPGLGHIRRTASGYAWVPVNYTRTP